MTNRLQSDGFAKSESVEVRQIPIADIVIGDRRRRIEPDKVAALAESIRAVGLLQPILVTSKLQLVYGGHRLAALRELGWERVPAIVSNMTKMEAELGEISENLIRNELSALERAEHIHRYDELLRTLGIRAKAGDNQHGEGPDMVSGPVKTTAELGREAGLNARTVRRDIQISRDIPPGLRDTIRGHELANQYTELLSLAKIRDPGMQVFVTHRVINGQAHSVANAVAQLRQSERRAAELVDMDQPPEVTILLGDALEELKKLPAESVHCAITSPPYWGLRDYGIDGQLGMEGSLNEYIEKMVMVFGELRRVLRHDGTLWLNMGDAYWSPRAVEARDAADASPGVKGVDGAFQRRLGRNTGIDHEREGGALKPKDLIGQPWRLAFALQADGWYLRSDIVWHKPNPLPESVGDRPTRSHEYVFLFSKSPKYYYDADAVREPATSVGVSRDRHSEGYNECLPDGQDRFSPGERTYSADGMRSLRDVWTIASEPCPNAHFATFPTALVEPCVKAGCPHGGVVLDPFGGSGTVGLVASRLGRSAILIELNPEYAEMAREKIFGETRCAEGCAGVQP